ncbi:MAG TPA: c-type cytochrome [Arachidicoccus soli]|uniref:Photosynthetic reaction center cytochrome c subunit n=2 Tax=Arachidicoccus soli TaxID=2341117 RepID=A0A386HMG8_9BACT|nr:c-type cytochrome [Arachidicoccus soli]HEU0228530.1 c-type cytochrome [Arachidicoccus soli]
MFNQNKNKGIILGLLSAVFVLIIMSFSSTQQPKHNFKILPQDITHDSLMGIMHGFNKALGVKCGFCHARSDVDSSKLNFASDAKKEKGFAREMMKMAAGINSTYFNWDHSARPDTIRMITCITCHRGNEKPIR